MRIAVVSNTAWYLFNFRGNLMRALMRAGHTVVAVSPPGEYVRKIEGLGLRHAAIRMSGAGTSPLQELNSVRDLFRVFRDQKIDLVLSNTPKGNLYSALACRRLRVPFVPNVSGLGRAFIRENWVTRVVKLLYRMTFGSATRVLFQNPADMATFLDLGLAHPEQCERIPGSGVDLERFQPTPLPERPQDAAVFLLSARMLRDKGVLEFVTAARALRARYPAVRCRMLGFLDVSNPSAISRAEMDAWVAEGVVEYLGSTDDVRPPMTDADCIVLPSYREGLPRTLLEAAALGRPVITTDAPGCRDAIIDGETGWLCRPRDAGDLRDRMQLFIETDRVTRSTMGQAGRRLIERDYDEAIVIGRYLDIVQNLSTSSTCGSTA